MKLRVVVLALCGAICFAGCLNIQESDRQNNDQMSQAGTMAVNVASEALAGDIAAMKSALGTLVQIGKDVAMLSKSLADTALGKPKISVPYKPGVSPQPIVDQEAKDHSGGFMNWVYRIGAGLLAVVVWLKKSQIWSFLVGLFPWGAAAKPAVDLGLNAAEVALTALLKVRAAADANPGDMIPLAQIDQLLADTWSSLSPDLQKLITDKLNSLKAKIPVPIPVPTPAPGT